MRYKFESFKRFKKFRSEVEKQTKKSLKVLQSDREGEYLSKFFFDYLKKMAWSFNGLHLECLSSIGFQNKEIELYWI